MDANENFAYFDKFVNALRHFARLLIWSLPKSRLHDQMINYFISRGDTCLGSAYILCKNNMFSDARILHRTMVDLVFSHEIRFD